MHDPRYGAPDDLGLSYEEFIATVDALVMGRMSFEKVRDFSPWPYASIPVLVLPEKGIDVPKHLAQNVQVTSGRPTDIVARLGSEGKRHLYVDGGVTIHRFLKAGLINSITITSIPILLGRGRPLFGTLDVEIPLQHVETTRSANGFVQNRYEVLNPGAEA